MTDKELSRLTRMELLELLVAQSRETEELREKLRETEEKLASRNLRVESAGSIARAALEVNGVYAGAEEAARQYLENIRRLNAETEEECAQMLQETKRRCQAMVREAEQDADRKWAALEEKLEAFYESHPGLRQSVEAGRSGGQNG